MCHHTKRLNSYLAGRYGAAPFWPGEGFARAHVERWAEWAKINVTLGFTVPIFWRVVRTAPSKQDPAAINAGVKKFDGLLDVAEAQLARGAFLAGDNFTLADIQLGSVLYRYFNIPITRRDRPVLRRYYDALTERPAFREHVMTSYEDLRVTD